MPSPGDAPADNGGTAVTGYTVSYKVTGSDADATTMTVTDAMATISDLTIGTSYDVMVAATNAVGTGDMTAATAVMTNNVPGMPTGVTATASATSAFEVTVSWTAPDADGGSAITGYTVKWKMSDADDYADADMATTDDAETMTHTVTGLSASTAYTFTVMATNAVGSGEGASATATTNADNTEPVGSDIPDQSVTVGGADVEIVLSEYFIDADGDTLTYDVTSAKPEIATASEANGVLTIVAVSHGTTVVSVTASDGSLNATQTINVSVTDPTLQPPSGVTATLGDSDPGVFKIDVRWKNSPNASTHMVLLFDSNFDLGDPQRPRIATSQDNEHAEFTVTTPGTYIAVVVAIDADGKYDYAHAPVTVGQ